MKAAGALAPALREAARMVSRVAAGRSLAEELERAAEDAPQSRAALIDLTHGTLRRYGRVQAIVEALSRRGAPDALVQALLWCSLYALESGRYAEYTVVDQAVRACTLLERWTAKGYVNGVLRNFLRERSALEARVRSDEAARHQHPRWWIDNLRRAYPESWEAILAAGNAHPPMTLRVNVRRIAADAYAQRLAAAGLGAQAVGEAALLLERPVPVERLPGFAEGEVSVQDAAAQRAAGLLDLAPGQRILDACAAPGGKSAHILERADVALTALDADPARCERMERNLRRLGLHASVRIADCTQPQSWWDGVAYERILADVPCTASGIARRHPDLKWLRRAGDAAAFAERQGAILDALWRLLAPGGKLLYVTCSVFPQENEEVVQAFIARAERARSLPLPDGAPQQWLPGPRHDGFYYALIQKEP
jgi:16S rRNA (cytosine967-C5)-methyltransferase